MKQVVKYNLDQYSSIVKNRNARVYPIDHPSDLVSNYELAFTSTVIAVNGDDFETLNTKYIGVHAGGNEKES
mgnify:CR=1 FL=1